MREAMVELWRIDDPLFLVCSERSGSTLLTHMLDHHPQMAWALALEFTVEMVTQPGQWPALDSYHDYLDNHLFFQTSGLRIDRRLGYLQLVHDFLAQVRARKGTALVGGAVHHYFDRLPWLFPSCRFIHLVRDGRDVSRSAVEMGFAGTVWRGAAHWAAAETLWDDVRAHLTPDRFHEVRYESLIRHPVETLRAICAFVGVPYSDRMLDYSSDTSYGPVDPQRVEQWRGHATEREIRIIEAVAGPLLTRRGYRLSGLPPLRIGRLRHLALREHDRYRRVRFRIAHDGFALTAADYLARHLGRRGWARRVQKRLDAIEKQDLQ
jgi:hypothetical protein